MQFILWNTSWDLIRKILWKYFLECHHFHYAFLSVFDLSTSIHLMPLQSWSQSSVPLAHWWVLLNKIETENPFLAILIVVHTSGSRYSFILVNTLKYLIKILISFWICRFLATAFVSILLLLKIFILPNRMMLSWAISSEFC